MNTKNRAELIEEYWNQLRYSFHPSSKMIKTKIINMKVQSNISVSEKGVNSLVGIRVEDLDLSDKEQVDRLIKWLLDLAKWVSFEEYNEQITPPHSDSSIHR